MKRFSRSYVPLGLLSFTLAASSFGAEKDKPRLPTGLPDRSTNAVPVPYLRLMKEPDYTQIPLLQRPFPEIILQRVHERVTDLFTPATITSVGTSRSAYDALSENVRDTAIRGLRRAGRDALTIGLNNLELRNRPLVDALPLLYGTAEGMDGRLLREPGSVFTFAGDTQFRPRQEAPHLTLGFEPWSTRPSGHATYAFREGTRILRGRTFHDQGELAFDIVDMLNLRVGVQADYFGLKERSQGFISTTFPGSVNVGIGSTIQGKWNVGISFGTSF